MQAQRRAVVDPAARPRARRTAAPRARAAPAGAASSLAAQRLQDGHEAVVAQALELAHGAARRLLVGLGDDAVEQLVGQLRHVGQLRPRPLQRRPELGHEVPHAALAAGDPVGEERAHERPAQPGAVADRVVDLPDRRDAVVHEPERLAPERLQQPVGDEAVDLAAHDQRLHPDGGRTAAARSTVSGAVRSPAHDLDQRQQVDGIERVPDDRAARGGSGRPASGTAAGPTSRSRRARRVGSAGRSRRAARRLRLSSLRGALLHEVGARDGGRERVGELQPRPRRRGARVSRRPGAPRVVEHLRTPARRPRGRGS